MRISKEEHQEFINTAIALEVLSHEFATIREILTRLVSESRPDLVRFHEECPEGLVKWETVETPAGSREMTIWFEPGDVKIGAEGRFIEALSNGNGDENA